MTSAVWHRRDYADTFIEPLAKAGVATHGAWGGMPIICIGPKGGKIVGYAAGGKPIYAGSKQAYKILATKHAKAAPTAHSVLEWLTQVIGVPAKIIGNEQLGYTLRVTEASEKLLSSHFHALKGKGHLSHDGGQFWNYPVHDLIPHLGQPLKPPTEANASHFAAKAAAGDADHDPFPPLSEMTEVAAGSLAGSHGNRVFVSKDGRKWVFKHDKPEIARAEEAADRIARLVLGVDHAPAAKHVKLGGKSGVLLEFIPGKILNESSHSNPPEFLLQAHFDAVVAHHVVDWLISNHDAHAGNFLVNDKGFAAIDKGQAWKWIGEDVLDTAYKGANSSWPIYHTFWNGVANGTLTGDPVAAAAKAIHQAETITPEQFEAIVAPYVAARAKKSGVPEVDLRGKLVARLKSLRSDWETFLSKQLGKPVTLASAPGKDNFETMPETEPDAPPVAVTPPQEPILEAKPAPGWPMTKGTVTIHHPGSPPPPDVKWPKGYPGPGFTSAVTYKGQLFTVEFELGGTDKKAAKFRVAYPDGSNQAFSSPNDASDSFVLYQRKLDLTMSATERKKLAISYPAAVAFGIKKFAAELAAAHSSPQDSLAEKHAPELKTIEDVLDKDPLKLLGEPATKPVSAPVTPLAATVPAKTEPAISPLDLLVAQNAGAWSAKGTDEHTIHTVEKTGLGKVALIAWQNGQYQVGFTFQGKPVSEMFNTISAAARFAFIHQKGYATAADYTAATGKIAPGVSWGFFGLKGPDDFKQKLVEPAKTPAPPTVNEPVTTPAPAHSKQQWIDGDLLTMKEIVGQIDLLPVGSTLDPHVESMAVWTKKGADTYEGKLNGVVTNACNAKVMAEKIATTGGMHAAVAASVPEKVKPSKFTAATIVTSITNAIATTIPQAAGEKMTLGFQEATGWSTMLAPNGVPIGAKSALWQGWVPPPGVFIEGQHAGKKFWMTAAAIGYNKEDGTPFAEVPIAIIDEQGNAHVSSKAPPAQALKEAALKAGIYSGSISVAKAAFNLNGTYWAPGETLKSIKEGTGPSKLPSLPQVLDKAPEDMTEKEAAQPVKASVTLQQAIETKLEGAHVMDKWSASGSATVVVNAKPHEGAQALTWRIRDFFKEHGLPEPEGIHLNASGAIFSMNAAQLQKEVIAVLSKGTAAALAQPSHDNWETMPEGIPKVIPVGTNSMLVEEILGKIPPGGRIIVPGLLDIFKDAELNWMHTESPSSGPSPYKIETAIQQHGASVIPPGGSPPLVVPTPRAPPALKVQKVEDEKVKQAKLLAAWAKDFKPVTDSQALHVLAHVQALVPKTKFYARMDLDGSLLLGFEKSLKLKSVVTKAVGKIVDTPLGEFWKVDVQKLADAIPGKPAGSIDGPDGKTYPAGTTFTSSEQTWKVYDLITSEVTKLSAHKTDASLVMVKVAGTGDEQKAKLDALWKKYDFPTTTFTAGGQYTMGAVPKTAIYDKIAKTETITTPVIPPQPPAYFAKPLPFASSGMPDWQEAAPNRADLAMLGSIKIGPTGHWVRMGAHGTFWNDQVMVRKVRDPAGKHHYEIIGQLYETQKGSLKAGHASFRNTDSHHYAHYSYGQQKYDEESGAAFETGSHFRAYPAYVGETAGGSPINVWNQYPSLDGVFRVRIEEGKDVETELAAAFQKMGLDPTQAMREQTVHDERLFIKHQVARALNGTAAYKWSASNVRDEEFLDGQIAHVKGSAQLVENAKVLRGFNGKQTVVIDDAEARKKAGVGYCYVGSGSSGITSIFARLREGQGFWSNRTKWLNGVEGNSGSVDSDVQGGGILGIFARFGNTKVKVGWGYKCDNVKMIIHPRALARTDWFALNTDGYGKWANNSASGRPLNYDNVSTDNEVCFEDGVSPRDLAGVTVNGESMRKQLIGWLKAEGINEYNGIPIEEFVVTYAGKERSWVVDNLKGLQPGVLP